PLMDPFLEAAIVVDLEVGLQFSDHRSQLSRTEISVGDEEAEVEGKKGRGEGLENEKVGGKGGRVTEPGSENTSSQLLATSNKSGLSMSQLPQVGAIVATPQKENETSLAGVVAASEDVEFHPPMGLSASNLTPQTPDLGGTQIRGPPREIVFVDSSLNLRSQLADAYQPGVVVSVFDAGQDGIAHITDALSSHNNLSTVHIISHGAPGQMVLGTSVLGSGSLDSHTDSLAAWGNALTSEGDILLYGCSVGQGQVGGEFVRQIAKWTDADVAASDDPTGSSELGGDWVLEVKAGTIRVSMPMASEMLVSFTSLLSDFGDAPSPYSTTLAENGARHGETGPTLGSIRDGEANGSHSIGADTDDTIGSDDEDGITFSTIQVGQIDAAVTVNVQHNSGTAYLDAWIDFNADGSWGGPLDQIADHYALVGNGDHIVHFDVPSWAISGETYARFRLSTTGQLAPAGLAADGEVEDYQV
ncbi:MAG: DUF4347 domain-containing protein, partial [Planctomycetes bacterium]|nr:DUF4347 domain-containing protein [Planctomycetota bacterium]